jgi:hypothetical protein
LCGHQNPAPTGAQAFPAGLDRPFSDDGGRHILPRLREAERQSIL